MTAKVALVEFKDYFSSIAKALNNINAGEIISRQKKIILKPNLIQDSPPPTTTDVRCVEAVFLYCREHTSPGSEIIIAEGSAGDPTLKCYKNLGYIEMSKRTGARLMDLDEQEFENHFDDRAEIYKTFPLFNILKDAFVISVPVLKDHSMTDTTLSLKNMIGIAPASKFSGYMSYSKSEVHRHDVNRALVDINLHKKADLAVIDGAIGMKNSHLCGTVCNPPIKKIIASFDPVAADAAGSEVLGWRWDKISYLRMANGLLGQAEKIEYLK